jgi:hypothetical protein
MDLQTKVVFNLTVEIVSANYTSNGRFVGTHEHCAPIINNMDEFRNFIANFTTMVKSGRLMVDKTTYNIKLKRNVIVSDQDDRVSFKSVTFPDKEISIILSTTDKLLYAGDIEKLLKPINPDFYMGKDTISGGKPIYLESFDGHDVKYRPLTQNGVINDVVIDTNLNQIWPVATGKPPIALVELISKTTEKVR